MVDVNFIRDVDKVLYNICIDKMKPSEVID